MRQRRRSRDSLDQVGGDSRTWPGCPPIGLADLRATSDVTLPALFG